MTAAVAEIVGVPEILGVPEIVGFTWSVAVSIKN